MAEEISPNSLKKQLNEESDIHLLDVREPHEHEEGHIEGSRLIPVGELTGRTDEIEDWKGDDIVTYCRSGNRSAMAAQILKSQGFDQVQNLSGGFEAWEEE